MFKKINQSTVNLVVISGVILMAVGAWVMPMYNAQLAHDDALDIINQVKSVGSDVSGITGDISGKGLTGGADLVTLLTSTIDESKLHQTLGDDFLDFQGAFLGSQETNIFGDVDVLTLIAAPTRDLLPDSFTGLSVLQDVAGGSNTCTADGVAFSPDLSTSGDPSNIDGFALLVPGAIGSEFIRVQVCLADTGDVIIDELVELAGGDFFTKNFDFGLVPPGVNLKVYIDDEANNSRTFEFWLYIHDPLSIDEFFDFGGLGAGDLCDITVLVQRDGDPDTDIGDGNAIVEIGHEFIPFFFEQPVDASSEAAFIDIPEGSYFVEVFSNDDTLLPFFQIIECVNGAAQTPTVVLQDAAAFAAAAGEGDLTVNITDQFGVPITNTGSFVDLVSGFVINDVCEDGVNGNAPTCPEIESDDIFGSATLLDGTADGTYTIENLPGGLYTLHVCNASFNCGFETVTVPSDDSGVTVTVEIFVPQ